ncbi:hypothetical protein HCN44_005269 [Aphidius gifuensis]|uniref:Peptidase S1 domain-containing protein n=1 Tax=Aphidius gifuensis TaxID=684658 RepID=A0A835CV12_APHGI|nr:transmembrane protease serine 3-like [Aphidius gifuensis]KAF7996992.1 hypothetical protein HCN44_005269 [Aphidius gifuensis]
MGGSRAQIEDFSSHVSVMFQKYPMCGGSIIDELHVVTAACCAVHYRGVFYSNLIVVAGADDLDDISPSNVYSVSFITFHENYLPRDLWVHDIAILTLTRPIIFSPKILPTPLLTQKLHVETPSRIPSFGQTYPSPILHYSRFLRVLNILAIAHHRCSNYYELFGNLNQNQNCILLPSPDSSVLMGDGGSGIYSQRRLLGIASFVAVNIGSPAVYTSIPPYLDFRNHNSIIYV